MQSVGWCCGNGSWRTANFGQMLARNHLANIVRSNLYVTLISARNTYSEKRLCSLCCHGYWLRIRHRLRLYSAANALSRSRRQKSVAAWEIWIVSLILLRGKCQSPYRIHTVRRTCHEPTSNTFIRQHRQHYTRLNWIRPFDERRLVLECGKKSNSALKNTFCMW